MRALIAQVPMPYECDDRDIEREINRVLEEHEHNKRVVGFQVMPTPAGFSLVIQYTGSFPEARVGPKCDAIETP